MQRYYGPVHHRLTACRRFLAKALDENGKSEEAVPILEQAVRNFDVTLGPDSKFTSISEFELASSLFHGGRYTETIQSASQALRTMQSPGGADRSDPWRAQALLSEALVKSGQAHEGLAPGELGRTSSRQNWYACLTAGA